MIVIGMFRLGVTNLLMWLIASLLIRESCWLRQHNRCLLRRDHQHFLLAIAYFFLIWGFLYDFPLLVNPLNPYYYVTKSLIGVITTFPVFLMTLRMGWSIRKDHHS